MPPAQKYHIDPREDRVVPCRKEVPTCEFGSLDTHFYDQDFAFAQLLLWRGRRDAWLTRSAYPPEAGWTTEMLFDPAREEDYKDIHVLFGYDIPEGTRLLMENGWSFIKLSFDDFWEMTGGPERTGGIKHGQPLQYYSFLSELERGGGRLEYTEGIAPISRLRWRTMVAAPGEEPVSAPWPALPPEQPAEEAAAPLQKQAAGFLSRFRRNKQG